MDKMNTTLDIPSDPNSITRRKIVYQGKVYIVEVRAKWKDTTPSWLILALVGDAFAAVAFIFADITPKGTWSVSQNGVPVVLLFIALVLIVVILVKGKRIQETDP